MLKLTPRRIVLLKALLVLIVLAGLAGQIFAHSFAGRLASPLPPEEFPSALYASLIVVTILNLQAIAVSLWDLLNLSPGQEDPEARVLRALTSMTRSGIGAALALGVMLVHASVAFGVELATLIVLLSGALVVAGLFIALMVTLRHVLLAALSMHSELKTVI